MLRVFPYPEAKRDLLKEGRFERLERKYLDEVDGDGVISAVPIPATFEEHFAGNCENPRLIRLEGRHRPRTPIGENGAPRLAVETFVRCRRCAPCLRARKIYWAMAALHQTQLTMEAGRRTWFGTLTLTREWQTRFAQQAAAASEARGDDWSALTDDERFLLVRQEIVPHIQRMWKRLRKKHELKYLLVFERHKSGLPHMHCLVHEVSAPILKRQLQAEWDYGFTKYLLVGGRAARAAAPAKAAWYVSKYLSKSVVSKQIASQDYKPARLNAHD